MNPDLPDEFAGADLLLLVMRLARFALWRMRRLRWRGSVVPKRHGEEFTVEGLSALDFVQRAFEKLNLGRRTYRPEFTLEQNLRAIIYSEIWSFHKRYESHPLEPPEVWRFAWSRDGAIDLVSAMPDPTQNGHGPEAREKLRLQEELLAAFKHSFDDDPELATLLAALEEGLSRPAEIEVATGIPARRVSALKRRLLHRTDAYVHDHPEFAEIVAGLERYKVAGGSAKPAPPPSKIRPAAIPPPETEREPVLSQTALRAVFIRKLKSDPELVRIHAALEQGRRGPEEIALAAGVPLARVPGLLLEFRARAGRFLAIFPEFAQLQGLLDSL